MTTSYGYDAASRLTSLSHDTAGSSADVTYGIGYLPSGQIGQRTVNNSAYDWPASAVATSYANNGLNQTISAGEATVGWEARGNLTSDGVMSYTYDASNRLLTGGGASLSYDPLDRLYQMVGTGAGRFQYDGSQLAGVYDFTGPLNGYWIGGAGPDEWLMTGSDQWYWTLQDHQGSVVAMTDGSGVATAINAWDEYGQPRPGNVGRMQYTGQMMLPDLGLQHYKARAYHAGLGRFVQTDPVGYEQGMNLYAYVGNDPVNATDPTGMMGCPWCDDSGRVNGADQASPWWNAIMSHYDGIDNGPPPSIYETVYTVANLSAAVLVGGEVELGNYTTVDLTKGEVVETGFVVGGLAGVGGDMAIGGGVIATPGRPQDGVTFAAEAGIGPMTIGSDGSVGIEVSPIPLQPLLLALPASK